MNKLVILVGESGSGKTTLCRELEKRGFYIIQSYTTRKQRCENEYGHTFVNEKPDDIESVLAYTYYAGNHYWATHEQYLDKGNVVYTLDPSALYDIKDKAKAEVIIIYLKADYYIRKQRLVDRCIEDKGTFTTKDTLEVHERLDNDIDKFRVIKADYILDAGFPTSELADIVQDIVNNTIQPIK